MKKIKEYKGIIIIILIILGFIFYWFQVRPVQARKECVKIYPNAFGSIAISYKPGETLKTITDKAGYEKCLREHGLDN